MRMPGACVRGQHRQAGRGLGGGVASSGRGLGGGVASAGCDSAGMQPGFSDVEEVNSEDPRPATRTEQKHSNSGESDGT